jgi:putative tryptophan/tyrosine transport system substrate-binding protein
MMRRREFITLMGGATAAWALAAGAQTPERIRHVAILMSTTASNAEGQANVAALRQGLKELGWAEGRNIRIDTRWSGGDVGRTNSYAAELVALKPDVIFACFNAQLAAVARETRAIPIVFVGSSDPVGGGFVASYARPGGNITGFTLFEPSMAGKWLAALKDVAPAIARVGIMANPETATLQGTFYLRAFEAAAATFMLEPITANVRSASDIETAIASLAQKPDSGLVVATDTFTTANGELIVTLAARHRLPAVYGFREFPTIGGLMSYGPNLIDAIRRSASYVDRILKGESPSALPVQASVKFELVINLKTAKALGLEIPPTLLARADEVIE